MEPRRDHREVDGSAVVDDRQAGGIDVAAVVGVGGTDDHRHGAIIRAGDPDAGILQGFEQPVFAQSDDRALPLDCRDMVGTGDGGVDHVLVGDVEPDLAQMGGQCATGRCEAFVQTTTVLPVALSQARRSTAPSIGTPPAPPASAVRTMQPSTSSTHDGAAATRAMRVESLGQVMPLMPQRLSRPWQQTCRCQPSD
jgi:hypothetical protein